MRSIDGAQAPAIPEEFIKKAQSAINMVGGVPQINPDICIVNFYNDTGRLGLHQDKDESRSSIEKGLPVISISIGDTDALHQQTPLQNHVRTLRVSDTG